MKRLLECDAIRFGIVGCCSVVLDFSVYHILLALSVPMIIAKGVSYILGASFGFVCNKLFTFKARGFRGNEIIKYILLYGVSMFLNTSINRFVYVIFEDKLISYLSATSVSCVLHYIGEKFFVFRRKEG